MAEKDNAKSGEVVAVEDKQPRHLPKIPKKLLLVILGLVALVIVITAGLKLWGNRNKQAVACNNDVIKEAVGALNPAYTEKLQRVTEKIKNIPNYEKDPNCLYPIVQYYIYTVNPAEAKANFVKLEKVYNPRAGFAPEYKIVVTDLGDIKKQVDGLEQIQKANEQNNIKID